MTTRAMMILQLTISLYLQIAIVYADFEYPDFNSTLGLVFNGVAATSSCVSQEPNQYSSNYGTADDTNAQLEPIQHQNHELSVSETAETDDFSTSSRISVESAGFNHRSTYASSPNDEQCDIRLRLTPSKPHQSSSVWHKHPTSILKGFETQFEFQITDQTRRCYEATDQHFSLSHYKNCIVHGGDGFAFVIQRESTTALGNPGSGMGYGGITSSLAIEFDTWYNANPSDIIWDHIAVHSNGLLENSPDEDARLTVPVRASLADGAVHQVKIAYYPDIQMKYVSSFSMSPKLTTFIKDVSEGRRVGTLVVFIDDGITSDTPIVALPINLAAVVNWEQDTGYVGFTASTGKSWEKHDILSWYYCEVPPCMEEKYNGSPSSYSFDYSQASTTLDSPSHPEGAYDGTNVLPDTSAWSV